jgi:DNA-binding LytR/AlgR family response regulator
MTSIIVEDIQMAADFLKTFCEKSGLVEVKGHFLNVADALAYLENDHVDLIFLDVEMPGATGFDLLDRLTYSPKIILTTSKTEYAFDAFQYNVSDYLKKPFTYKRFLESIQRIQKPEETPVINIEPDYLFIKANNKLVKLQNDEILFIEGMRDYVRFVTATGKYMTLSTLKHLEEKLNKLLFLKVHRSYIVNISKITDISGNTIYIAGNEIPIGKGHRDEVVKRLNIL